MKKSTKCILIALAAIALENVVYSACPANTECKTWGDANGNPGHVCVDKSGKLVLGAECGPAAAMILLP